MIQFLDIRRHSEGSIDFDFYRRRATRQRRLAKRLVLTQYLTLIGQLVRTVISAIERYWKAAQGYPLNKLQPR